MKVMSYEIVNFAGFYKIIDTRTNERRGGLYPTVADAEAACIELEREYLGIKKR